MSDAAIELLYEETLKLCRDLGHDLISYWHPAGELLICQRCEAVFEERP